MIGLSALVAAILHVVMAIAMLVATVPAPIRPARSVLALAAGALGAAHWHAGADSRWLVGGILLLMAGAIAWPGRMPGAGRIAGLMLGLAGLGLYAIATATAPLL